MYTICTKLKWKICSTFLRYNRNEFSGKQRKSTWMNRSTALQRRFSHQTFRQLRAKKCKPAFRKRFYAHIQFAAPDNCLSNRAFHWRRRKVFNSHGDLVPSVGVAGVDMQHRTPSAWNNASREKSGKNNRVWKYITSEGGKLFQTTFVLQAHYELLGESGRGSKRVCAHK